MSTRPNSITQAWLDAADHCVIELAKDWRAKSLPPVTLHGGVRAGTLRRRRECLYGFASGYYVTREGKMVFVLRLEGRDDLDPESDPVSVAGDFNAWAGADHAEWAMVEAKIDGERVLEWTGEAARFFADPPMRFKFVTKSGRWLPVPHEAPNVARDDQGNTNHFIDPERTGLHLYECVLAAPADLTQPCSVHWNAAHEKIASVPVRPGEYFHALHSDLPLGAVAHEKETIFRLFAPRATKVTLHISRESTDTEGHPYALRRSRDTKGSAGLWEVVLDENLHGWFYWYQLEGPADVFSRFDPSHRVLDPYARACLGREGPGIVIDANWLGRGDRGFKTPAWQDLVIAEAHVRDLTARAPVRMEAIDRRGFSGLRRWVESPDFHLHHLGVNCVELQPVQENDARTADEYHWGYMTSNFFAPHSGYSLDPERASGVRELQKLVAAFHRRGIAVVLDVVFNHVGEPAHLLFVDKLYYFEQNNAGELSNWSGCGNDLRATSAMARRLITDSCIHFVETYGVDGFRFDLADLIGVEVLREIERALKRVKPDVILIAEPWSFRGHIGGELRDTGWASWNDGYRNFLREYVRGGGSREGFEYFLKGSPWHYAKWPAQTVNYTESHDDRAWIDVITENPDNNGFHPTANDRRRTHLMAAILFASIGIPMVAAGQDFLRSKQGVNNTYQRGDLNALDYRRIYRFPGTHDYFADWIAFRRSKRGALLRHFSRATEGFFRFFWADNTTAAAVVYNADFSQGPERLLFAVNPTPGDVTIALGALAEAEWRQLADHERFFSGLRAGQPVEEELFVPALGCGLWVSEGGRAG